jgi:hypothetical protein
MQINGNEKNQRHCICFSTGGITLQVEADLPITKQTFKYKFKQFLVNIAEEDFVILRHHFNLPDISDLKHVQLCYRRAPWAIYRGDEGWTYLGIATREDDPTLHRVVLFNENHTRGEIYNPNEEAWRRGGLDSITLFPTDQILLARLLADRGGCILHSAGMILDGKGFVFAGHSGAGKSTMVTMLRPYGEILCDDRIIVRQMKDGMRIYGTWSHGDVPDVSPNSAPLGAILMLEQAEENRLIQLTDRKEILHRLLPLVVKPLATADWWEKTLDVLERIARETPVYRLRFERSGRVIETLKKAISG